MISGFDAVVFFGFLSAMLLVGVFLRAKVKFIQNMLIPASIIAGLLGFLVIAIGNSLGSTASDGTFQTALTIAGVPITHKGFTSFVFHTFNISFMSLMLTRATGPNTFSSKTILKGGMWQTFIWSFSLGGQALVGGAVIMLYNAVTGGSISELFGFIATHGYTQGPGQAYAIGLTWEKAGIVNAVSVGLIYAGMGFFSAILVGVPLARWMVRKGLNSNKRAILDKEFLSGIMHKDSMIPNGRETTHSANIDCFCFQLAIVGVTYLLTYMEVLFLQTHVRPYFMNISWLLGVGNFFSVPMLFFHGLYVGLIVRKAFEYFGAGQMIDPIIQKRITGTSVDLLVVATLMAIEFAILKAYALPIFLVCAAVTLFTLWMVLFFGRRLTELGPERIVTQFGACCGSAASGMLLLRILDPDYSTPVAIEVAIYNIAILVSSSVIIFIVAPMLYSMSLTSIFLIYGAYTLAMGAILFLLRLNKVKRVW